MSRERSASSNGKLITYRGTEQIKYIMANGDQIDIAREKNYKN